MTGWKLGRVTTDEYEGSSPSLVTKGVKWLVILGTQGGDTV